MSIEELVARIAVERERVAKCKELAAMFAGMPVSSGPYQDKGGWKISFAVECLTEPQLRVLADRLQSVWPLEGPK